MIGHLIGKVVWCDGSRVVVSTASGVGYELYCSQLYELDRSVELFVTTIMRESQLDLYAHQDWSEKELFDELLKVKGLGPKTSFALLTHLGVGPLLTAIRLEDRTALTRVPGVGGKTAAQVLLDLKGKVETLQTRLLSISPSRIDAPLLAPTMFQEALNALNELGLRGPNHAAALEKIWRENPNSSAEELIRAALKSL